MRHRYRLFIALAAGLLPLGPTMAQQPAASQPALGGPKIREEPAKATLIERDFSGKLKRLDSSPEEVALPLLNLDADTKAKTDAILAERAAILDKAVIDNLDLVIQIHNAKESGDKAEKLRLLGELMKHLKPLTARGPLVDELAATMPKPQADTFKKLVADYRDAAIAENQADAKARGEKLTQRQATIRENLVTLGLDIKRSYNRQITARVADFERILAELNLSPEQETKVRNMVVEFAQQTKGRPTADDKRSLFFKIMAVLDSEQQKTLMRLYAERQ